MMTDCCILPPVETWKGGWSEQREEWLFCRVLFRVWAKYQRPSKGGYFPFKQSLQIIQEWCLVKKNLSKKHQNIYFISLSSWTRIVKMASCYPWILRREQTISYNTSPPPGNILCHWLFRPLLWQGICFPMSSDQTCSFHNFLWFCNNRNMIVLAALIECINCKLLWITLLND